MSKQAGSLKVVRLLFSIADRMLLPAVRAMKSSEEHVDGFKLCTMHVHFREITEVYPFSNTTVDEVSGF